MESNRSNKRKGFAKSKMLMKSLYRSKPKAEATAPPPATAAAVGYIIVKQDQVFPPHHNSKVAFVEAEYGKLENFYSDEAVDAKAARYISGVQERFRLELINSETINMHLM